MIMQCMGKFPRQQRDTEKWSFTIFIITCYFARSKGLGQVYAQYVVYSLKKWLYTTFNSPDSSCNAQMLIRSNHALITNHLTPNHSNSSLLTCQLMTIIHNKNTLPTIYIAKTAFQSLHNPKVSRYASVASPCPGGALPSSLPPLDFV